MNRDERHCRLVGEDPYGRDWDDEVRAHAEKCPRCRAFLESMSALKERLTGLALFNEPMPSALKERMLAQLAGTPAGIDPGQPRRRARIFPLRHLREVVVPMAIAASLVVGILLGSNLQTGKPETGLEVNRTIGMYINDVTHDHYLLQRLNRPLEVAMTDEHQLSQWLSESLNFTLDVPASDPDFTLEGGRVWHTVGRLSAMASYVTPRGDRAILFAVPATNLQLRGAESSLVNGRQVFTGKGWGRQAWVWIKGDLAVALVAPEGQIPSSWVEEFLP